MDSSNHISNYINLNLNIRGLTPSATLVINERSKMLEAEGNKIYRLGLGQSPFPVPESVQQALRNNTHQKNYLPVEGLPELREAIAKYHSRKNNVHYKRDNILVGPGSKELMFLLQLVYYGDLVIPTPSWVSYAPQAHIIGRQVRWITTRKSHYWKFDPGLLSEYLAKDVFCPRILILNSPSNPTGFSYTVDELKVMADLARKHKLVVLSDEIYAELHHGNGHQSIASYYPEGTIISSGLSKWCGAGGWRLGCFAFPDELMELQRGMAVAASETFTSTCAPIQYAAVTAFEFDEDIEQYVIDCRKILAKLGTYLFTRLSAAGLDLLPPQGGFYIFPDFEPFRDKLKAAGIETSYDLCESLLKDTGVATLPGAEFGRPDQELTLRIAYVDFEGKKALEAVQSRKNIDNLIDDAFLSKYCGPVVQATGKIEKWLRGL